MSEDAAQSYEWRFVHFGVFVTGRGEAQFLPSFLRSLAARGNCNFEVIRKIGQRSPITSEKKKLKMAGTGKQIPDRDANEIGFPARRYLAEKRDSFVMLIDDLEHERRPIHNHVFVRYRDVFNKILPPAMHHRASVHFFVNMVEAYFFADAQAINGCLNTSLEDHQGDVESIRHPKNDLKRLHHGYDEVEDGACIAKLADLPKVLSNAKTCRSLRSLFKWCSIAKGDVLTDEFQLISGECDPVTAGQVAQLQ